MPFSFLHCGSSERVHLACSTRVVSAAGGVQAAVINSREIKVNFMTKTYFSIFLTLALPVCTRHPISSHLSQIAVYTNSVLKECSRQASHPRDQHSVFWTWAARVLAKTKFEFLKFRSICIRQTGSHTAHRHRPRCRTCRTMAVD